MKVLEGPKSWTTHIVCKSCGVKLEIGMSDVKTASGKRKFKHTQVPGKPIAWFVIPSSGFEVHE